MASLTPADGGSGQHAPPTARPYTPSPAPPQHANVGFIGLGNMGYAMSSRLAKGLKEMDPPLGPLLVYNRTTSKSEKLAKELGEGLVEVVHSVEEIGKRCHFVFTSLSNDEAAVDVYAKLCKGEEQAHGSTREQRSNTPHHVIFVDTSTLYPDTTGAIERQVSALPRRHFVAAPAFGPPPMARAGTLLFAVAGPYASKQAISHLLTPHMGRKIMDFGGNPEQAAKFKLIGNSWILGIIEMLSETMTLADKTGVGRERFFEWIEEFFPAPSAIAYGRKIVKNDFSGEEGFTLTGGIKDCTHIRKLATAVDCPMGVMDQAHAHMVAARANGAGNKDWSSLVGGQRISAGLDPWQGHVPGLVREGQHEHQGQGQGRSK